MVDLGGELFERTARGSDAGLRLDRFWARELADRGVSRERAKDWIRAGQARLDGSVCDRPDTRLCGGERLTLGAPPGLGDWRIAPRPEPGDLDVVHADEHVVVLDKPAGLVVHPAPGLPAGTLVQRLLHRFPGLAGLCSDTDRFRPGIVHRLDKDTSGLIAAALTAKARLRLAAEFASRRVRKTYLALVRGRVEPEQGTIDAPIGRHPVRKTKMAVVGKGGRPARTGYRTLWGEPRGRASLLALDLFTGRTHQIRVHLAHLGHPLFGDATYGPARAAWPGPGLAPRQMLHAFRLAFDHPEGGERLDFSRPPPADFLALLHALAASCLRVGVVGLPGSGKSELLRLLSERGEACFSADDSVSRLYAPGGEGAGLLAARFGGRFSAPGGGVDRGRLFAAMRDSGPLRREVMDLVHPLVRRELAAFFAANADRPRAFAEIPLLLESGWQGADLLLGAENAQRFHAPSYIQHAAGTGLFTMMPGEKVKHFLLPLISAGEVDLVLGVFCAEAVRLGPLREKRGVDPARQAVFDSWQWGLAEKLGRCQLVLDNPGDPDGLAERAEALLRVLDFLAASRRARFAAWLSGLWQRLAAEAG